MKSFGIVKSLAIIFILICVSMIFLSSNLVSAVDQNDISATAQWTTSTFFAGVTNNGQITLQNDQDLTIYYIGVHFDWMPSESYCGIDLSSSPAEVPSGNSYVSQQFSVDVPANVTEGSHTYYVAIDGADSSSNTFSWDSAPITFNVGTSTQRFYNVLLSMVETQLSEANSANYQNAQAKSLLSQAQSQYELVPPMANAGNWTDAVVTLEQAYAFLQQASAAEQNNPGSVSNSGSLTIYEEIVIIAVVAAAVVTTMFLMVRRKLKQNDLQDNLPPPPPPTTQEETP